MTRLKSVALFAVAAALSSPVLAQDDPNQSAVNSDTSFPNSPYKVEKGFPDAGEFNPTGRQGVYGGFQSWVNRAGRFRSIGDGQVDFPAIFAKLTANDFDGWAVLEWECCLKHPEDGAREGAQFIADHIIRVADRAFDDFAAGEVDRAGNRRMLGLG